MKRSRTKAEREHLSRVAELGCWACRKDGNYGTPAEIHHIRDGMGMAQRASDFETIPLCPAHHRTGERGTLSVQNHYQQFQNRYGSERQLLIEVLAELAGL